MLTTLDNSGILDRSTVGGVHLYAICPAPKPEPTPDQAVAPLLFSSAAVAEYDASMSNIDEVLARLGVEIDDNSRGEAY